MKPFPTNLVETIRQPALVLDSAMRIAAANQRFYREIGGDPKETADSHFFALHRGFWDNPHLRHLLQRTLDGDHRVEDFEVGGEFPGCGARTLLLSACRVRHDADGPPGLLLVLEDRENVAVQRRAEHERQRLEFLLGERLKELRLLHRVATLLQDSTREVDELLTAIVAHLPAGWQHSEVAAARIRCGEHDISSENYRKTPWRQRAPIAAGGRTCYVEVTYLEERPEQDEGPFLREEREVLDSVAEMLRAYLERQRVTAELTRTNRLLRAVADNSSDAIFVKDREGKYLLFNQAASTFVGRAVEEVLGRDDTEVFDPVSARLVRKRDLQVMESGELLAEEEKLTAAGVTRVYHAVKAPYRDERGRVIGLIGISRDITERKEAEEALRESEERFRAFMDNCPAAAFIKDEQGRFLYVNPAWKRQFDLEPTQWEEKTDFDFWPREVAELFRASDRECLTRGEPLQIEESGQRPCDSVLRTWMVLKFPLDSGGERRVGGMAWDVTDRARAEEARRQLQEQLLQSQKMEGIGRLAGGIAHDFNNMLAVISGYAELLRVGLPVSHPLRSFAEEIGKAGDRAAGLTRQLLAFSRRQLIEPKVLDLKEVLVNLDKMLRRLIGEDIELVTLSPPEPLTAKADATQLEQAIVNLVINARDAMPTGGTVTLGLQRVRIESGWPATNAQLEPGFYVLLTVRDTGTGIRPEDLPYIFDPFFTTKGVGKGTGLGLSTVYGIVCQSGGYLRVESTPGRGSCFFIYLPAAGAPAGELPGADMPALPQGTETILVVEDEPMVHALMTGVLRRCGYTVLDAMQADEAVRLVDDYAGPIHLLLTDVVMPRMSGPLLAEAVLSRRPGIPVLFVSGYTDDAVIRHGVQTQEVEFLQKPFGMQDLAERVRRLLDRRTTEERASVLRPMNDAMDVGYRLGRMR